MTGLPVRDAVVELHSAKVVPARSASLEEWVWRKRPQQFTPGTLIVAKGSTVAFPNLDKVRHSIYSFSKPATVRD